jgi:hypothetical protein
MATKTLYVNDEDERVWDQARALSGDRTESLSRLATEGLFLLLAERQAAAEPVAGMVPEDSRAIERFGRELRRLGWERAGRAFTRACIDYGAARSRAKRKADEALGPEGRASAARKASGTKGVEGRKAAARKAWNTRKARLKESAAKE